MARKTKIVGGDFLPVNFKRGGQKALEVFRRKEAEVAGQTGGSNRIEYDMGSWSIAADEKERRKESGKEVEAFWSTLRDLPDLDPITLERGKIAVTQITRWSDPVAKMSLKAAHHSAEVNYRLSDAELNEKRKEREEDEARMGLAPKRTRPEVEVPPVPRPMAKPRPSSISLKPRNVLKKGPEFELKAAIDEDSTVTELLESLLKGKISMELRQVLAISKPEYRKAIVEMLRRRRLQRGTSRRLQWSDFLPLWRFSGDGRMELMVKRRIGHQQLHKSRMWDR